MKKTIIATAIITTLVLVTAYHAYVVYRLNKVVSTHNLALNQHEAVLGKIVELINSSTSLKK